MAEGMVAEPDSEGTGKATSVGWSAKSVPMRMPAKRTGRCHSVARVTASPITSRIRSPGQSRW